MKAEYYIKKILNFPIEAGKTIEVFQEFIISAKSETGRAPYSTLNPDEIEKLIPDFENRVYSCKSLYCVDDENETITLFDVSIIICYQYNPDNIFECGFRITQNGFIVGTHVPQCHLVSMRDS